MRTESIFATYVNGLQTVSFFLLYLICYDFGAKKVNNLVSEILKNEVFEKNQI
jgi:hypothetical protein